MAKKTEVDVVLDTDTSLMTNQTARITYRLSFLNLTSFAFLLCSMQTCFVRRRNGFFFYKLFVIKLSRTGLQYNDIVDKLNVTKPTEVNVFTICLEMVCRFQLPEFWRAYWGGTISHISISFLNAFESTFIQFIQVDRCIKINVIQ